MKQNAYNEMVRLLMAPKKSGGGGMTAERATQVATVALTKLKEKS